MTVTNASFRADYPAFSNPTAFPDQQVNLWLNVANLMLTPAAADWDVLYDTGIELLVAHNLSIEAENIKVAAKGTPGQSTGPVMCSPHMRG